MSRHTIRPLGTAAAVTALALVACTDRTSPAGPRTLPDAPAEAAARAPANPKPERLARLFARALQNPAFRAYVKAQLDASPFREHKLQFQQFLGAAGGRAVRALAQENGLAASDVEREVTAAIALEVYLPVPAHRAAWTGDENILVATAIADGEAPVAFDPRGARRLLHPDVPPTTPVLAVVPLETDFTIKPQAVVCLLSTVGCEDEPPPPEPPPLPPPQPSPPPPGLYMTKAHFVQDFEGWLKGNPEFEAHILGQKGQTDSLTDYQCAGEHAGGPYAFDQNGKDWSGTVLLFSGTQIAQYNTQHPNQNFRVFFVEDDDEACKIKANKDLMNELIRAVDGSNGSLTAGNDSSDTSAKKFKFALALQKVLTALASIIKSNDELIGNAVEDDIALEFHTGYNWIVKGKSNATNGWVNLEMR
ncbi:MAG: hypothetical protein ACREL9_08720 [Gemmatimonadales bacterium]